MAVTRPGERYRLPQLRQTHQRPVSRSRFPPPLSQRRDTASPSARGGSGRRRGGAFESNPRSARPPLDRNDQDQSPFYLSRQNNDCPQAPLHLRHSDAPATAEGGRTTSVMAQLGPLQAHSLANVLVGGGWRIGAHGSQQIVPGRGAFSPHSLHSLPHCIANKLAEVFAVRVRRFSPNTFFAF